MSKNPRCLALQTALALAGLVLAMGGGCGGSGSKKAEGGPPDSYLATGDGPVVTPTGGEGSDGGLGGTGGAGGMIDGGPAANCGLPGYSCCDGNACRGGGCCVSGLCMAQGVACAGLGEQICNAGMCGSCGGLGYACCAAGSATPFCTAPGATCLGTICGQCGSLGEACCAGGSCAAGCCLGGYCRVSAGTCPSAAPDAGSSPDAPITATGGSGGADANTSVRGGATGTAGAGGADGGMGGAGGADATAGTVLDGGFSTTLSCNGPLVVFLGMRPPQGAGSDVICWTAGAGAPVGDQLWTYDPATRFLVNQVSHLALKKRANGTFEAGASATDGTPLTLQKNADGTYSFVLGDGSLIGIGASNCQGALFANVLAGSSGYQTSFTYVPTSPSGTGGTGGATGMGGQGGSPSTGGALSSSEPVKQPDAGVLPDAASPASKVVSIVNGKAEGAMTGWGWVDLGADDTVTDPVCLDPEGPVADGVTCMDTLWSSLSAYCVSGTLPALSATPTASEYTNNWGIRINITASTESTGTLGQAFTSVAVSLTGAPTTGLRLIIHRQGDTSGTVYCSPITSGSFVSFSSFNTACWDGSGTRFSASSVTKIDRIGILVPPASTRITLSNFCLTGITFK